MKAGKKLRNIATNKKPVSDKLLSATTKLVQDKLPPGSPEAWSLEDSSNKDDNDIRLLPVRAGKGPRTAAANRKPASGKLLLTLIKLALGIRQDVRAKKILTLKTG